MYKTKKYFKFTFSSFFLLLFFLSCETIVDVELPEHKPLIVVNSICNPDKAWKLNLSASKGILDDGKIEAIKDAKIEILENGNPVTTFNHYIDGTYKSTGAKPKVNVKYNLVITKDGFETVTSTCVIPKAVKIKSVAVETITNKYQQKESKLTISFTDTPNIENFYSLEIFRIATYEERTYIEPVYFSSNDLLFNDEGNVLFEDQNKRFNGEEAFFTDEIIDGEDYKLTVTVGRYSESNNENFEVVLNSLNKDYYKYLLTMKLQGETQDNPFAEPTIVFNNIKNGLGIFAGYNSFAYKIF